MLENRVTYTMLAKKISLSDQKDNVTTRQQVTPGADKQRSHIKSDSVNLSYSHLLTDTYNSALTFRGELPDSKDLLTGLVEKVFKEQTINYKADDNSKLDNTTIRPEEAQELVAENGYFGVEKTSSRIFNFATLIAGGDPARISAVREGVENGIQEALQTFGGWLPDISYDTYDAVMTKLDDWAGIGSNQNSQN